MDETPQLVLVVTPHPDDAEIWCGGTVARWVREGAQVHYVLCTDGGRGTDRPGVTSRELATARQREQLDAARLLGVKDVVMLGHPDGELEDTAQFRKELVRQVRQVRPEVVLCPEPYRRNLAWHRDHRMAGQVTLDAVFPYARDHLHFVELWRDEKLEPHKTGTVLFWGADLPDTFIDITGVMDLKLQAVQAHRSQMAHRPAGEVAALVQDRAKEAATGHGFQYAEAFRKMTFRT
ncbi:MAG TPA: PIG-L deacetylase family protein [Dehalococcoidia bacterium]|nr:PIG-L deacetylase family protein [Dehalococcoidia bacterium]